jgi:hypothetical protein
MCKLVCGMSVREKEYFIHDPGDETTPGVTGDLLAVQLENVVNLNTLLKANFETIPPVHEPGHAEDATPWPNDDVLVLDLFVPDPPVYLRPAKYEYLYLLPCGQGREAIVKASTPPVIGGTAAGAKA